MNINLRYCLTSEQMLVQQASWYMENGAITLLIHLLSQHGIIHGNCAKIWEQILPWLNRRIKTSFLLTCWGILAGAGMGGLGCIGKLITNFIVCVVLIPWVDHGYRKAGSDIDKLKDWRQCCYKVLRKGLFSGPLGFPALPSEVHFYNGYNYCISFSWLSFGHALNLSSNNWG